MSNCLIFALGRWFSRGGYLIIRKSKRGPYPHFIWAKSIDGLPVEHYTDPDPKAPKQLFILFRGKILDRDPP